MTTRKKPNVTTDAATEAILNELLDSAHYNPGECFKLIEPSTFRRLLVAVTALGGMVTFYCDRVNHSDSISIRFGERKAAFALDPDGPYDVILDQLTNRYEAGVAKLIASQQKAK